jgi:flagellar biosynthetic protein FliR
VFVGLAIGFVASMVVAAVEIAGELVGLEMGFGIGAAFDPQTGAHGAVVPRFLQMLALLVFVTANGHHLVIRAAGRSFQRIGPGGALEPAMAGGIVSLGHKVVEAGCALAAPLVAILVTVNVALALLGRVAPQANVFMVGLPLSIGVGLLGLLEDLPALVSGLGQLVAEIPADIDTVFLGATHGLR